MEYTEIIVAAIATTGVLGAAVLPTYISNRKKTQKVAEQTENIAEQIGQTNGHGTIAEMISKVINSVSVLEDAIVASKTRITVLEYRDKEKKDMLEELRNDVKDIKAILTRIIQEVEDTR